MTFSQRMGFTPAQKSLQLTSIDIDLKNRLWNVIDVFVQRPLINNEYRFQTESMARMSSIWHSFFKLPFDEMPANLASCLYFIKQKFYKGKCNESYDVLEMILHSLNLNFLDMNDYVKACNEVLEEEFSAYRFINNQLSPIANEHELRELEVVFDNMTHFSAFQGVNVHLSQALTLLSDRKNPDYRNSIKESISAVEAVCKILSGGSKDSLGGALDKIKGKLKIHPSLERGFKQLYGYTSDGDGIRHALTEETNCDQEDAKFMLISCSSFINYLIVKAVKVGLLQDGNTSS